MRLLGAKEFLKTVKAGNLCIEFWLDDEDACLELIKCYKSEMSLQNILERFGGEFYIFGDNSGSLAIEQYLDNEVDFIDIDEEPVEIDGHIYRRLNYYDKNIIGDASPRTTLQLVFDNKNEWPNIILGRYDKKDIERIQKWFLKNNKFKSDNSYALDWLNEEDKANNPIINYK